ncbi:MAG: response regulator [Fimbriimonadaceae bacterium]|nr:response regulator [Chitinophagales bacterium]
MNLNEIEIVLVEDNLADAELTIRALKDAHIMNNLIHLKNGEEALDFLYSRDAYVSRNANIHPKVILLDLRMPKISGIEVLREIKSDENLKSIPIVVLTSSTEDPDVQECYKLGVNSYISKPVEFNRFAEVVGQLGLYWLLLNTHV